MRLLKIGSGKFHALVDDEDFPLLSSVKWQITDQRSSTRYAYRRCGPRRKHVYLHQAVMNARFIDHKDGNGLNCTKANLRIASQSQNTANRGLAKTNRSGFKGVSWSNSNKGWIAQIRHDGIREHLGTFTSRIAAACAYNDRAREAFGEFAWLNPVTR